MKRLLTASALILLMSCGKDTQHGVPFTYRAECVSCTVTAFEPVKVDGKYQMEYKRHFGVEGTWSKSFVAGANRNLHIKAEGEDPMATMTVSIIVNGETAAKTVYQPHEGPNVVALIEAEYKLSNADWENAD